LTFKGRPETAPGGSPALKQERKTTMAQNGEGTWTSYLTEVSEADFWNGVEDLAYAIDGERPRELAALIDEFLDLPARVVLSEAERADHALLRRYAVVNLLQSFLRVSAPERARDEQRMRKEHPEFFSVEAAKAKGLGRADTLEWPPTSTTVPPPSDDDGLPW
jgi:hypothetical protein